VASVQSEIRDSSSDLRGRKPFPSATSAAASRPGPRPPTPVDGEPNTVATGKNESVRSVFAASADLVDTIGRGIERASAGRAKDEQNAGVARLHENEVTQQTGQ